MHWVDKALKKALSCPFCRSGNLSSHSNWDEIDGMGVGCVECRKCQAHGPMIRSHKFQDALEAWNLRKGFEAQLSFVLRGFCSPWGTSLEVLQKKTFYVNLENVEMCPFCSCTHTYGCEIQKDRWRVFCNNCDGAGPVSLAAELGEVEGVNRWNRREKVYHKDDYTE